MTAAHEFPTLLEVSVAGRRASLFNKPVNSSAADLVPAHLRRSSPARLPEVAEPELMRHFVRLSQRNHCIDTGFYPLGSCTMKYNPKVHETIAALPGFARLHPRQRTEDAQGALEVMWNLQHALAELSGLPAISLQPAAGAHGEFAGLMIMRAWHTERFKHDGTPMPTHVLIPDTAHGTNPASVTMAGFKTLSVKTDERGGMDLDDVRAKISEHTIVGLMLTNPNTLGLFDERIKEIAEAVHAAGGLLYYDGANFNAIMGRVRPGDMGFDIVHFNTHKSFSTPHGGGGPGAGPIAVAQRLEAFLPIPRVVQTAGGAFDLSFDAPLSLGSIKHFWGNFGVLLRAWAYIRSLGRDGLVDASETAVLNANYLLAKLSPVLDPLYGRRCMHEFVVSALRYKQDHGVRALDIAKRLIDFGYHPPTIYFPLLIPEALMLEPTETETRETLDAFADTLIRILDEAENEPALLFDAPTTSPVRRVDEVRAVRSPILRDGIEYGRPDADEPKPGASGRFKRSPLAKRDFALNSRS